MQKFIQVLFATGALALVVLAGLNVQAQGSVEVCVPSMVGQQSTLQSGISQWAEYPLVGDLPTRTVPSGAVVTIIGYAVRNDNGCFAYIDVRAHPDGWVWAQDLFPQAEGTPEAQALPQGFAFGNPSENMAGGGFNIVIRNEGAFTPATVPYGSLISTWVDLNTRSSELMLCLAPAGCNIVNRGDWRNYVFADETQIPPEVFRSWIGSQLQFFPHAERLVDNTGNELWHK